MFSLRKYSVLGIEKIIFFFIITISILNACSPTEPTTNQTLDEVNSSSTPIISFTQKTDPIIPIDPNDTSFRAIHMEGNWGTNQEVKNYIPDDYFKFLQDINANWIGISVALHIGDRMDSTVERVYDGVRFPTFTDEELKVLIDAFHRKGLRVYLTLSLEEDKDAEYPVQHMQLGDPKLPSEDSEILPEFCPWSLDHPDHEDFVKEFWDTYTKQAVHFGELAQDTGIEMYSLGTETDYLFRSRSGGYWENDFNSELVNLISSVRSVYNGDLTYNMFYQAIVDRDFYGPGSDHLWEDLGLDVIGISAYFPLLDKIPATVPSVDSLEQSWQRIFDDYLIPLKNRYPDYPIIFLEFGFTNTLESSRWPGYGFYENWTFKDNNNNGLDDGEETQANIYDAFFNIRTQNPDIVEGCFLWGHTLANDATWDVVFGKRIGFAVRQKLAQDIIRNHYLNDFD